MENNTASSHQKCPYCHQHFYLLDAYHSHTDTCFKEAVLSRLNELRRRLDRLEVTILGGALSGGGIDHS